MSGAVLSLMGAAAGGGGSSTTITVASQNIQGYTVSPTVASATYRLNADGNVYQKINSGAYTLVTSGPNWCVPASQASNYECYASLIASFGAVGGSARDTWLSLGTTREWLVQQSTVGYKFATLSIGIRRIGTTTILSANLIDIYAEAT